jgi:hypothetical protein
MHHAGLSFRALQRHASDDPSCAAAYTPRPQPLRHPQPRDDHAKRCTRVFEAHPISDAGRHLGTTGAPIALSLPRSGGEWRWGSWCRRRRGCRPLKAPQTRGRRFPGGTGCGAGREGGAAGEQEHRRAAHMQAHGLPCQHHAGAVAPPPLPRPPQPPPRLLDPTPQAKLDTEAQSLASLRELVGRALAQVDSSACTVALLARRPPPCVGGVIVGLTPPMSRVVGSRIYVYTYTYGPPHRSRPYNPDTAQNWKTPQTPLPALPRR